MNETDIEALYTKLVIRSDEIMNNMKAYLMLTISKIYYFSKN